MAVPLRSLARALGALLEIPLQLCAATRPGVRSALSHAERLEILRRRELGDERRWSIGRDALKALLERLGEDTDTSRLCFPSPRVTLTHCGDVALAAGISGAARFSGIGIDMEEETPATTRFFLTARERRRRWSTASMLRLWTVKEALFKADPDNAGRVLTNYRLEDPSQDSGRAFAFDNVLEYSSLAIPGGMLSVAILRSASLR